MADRETLETIKRIEDRTVTRLAEANRPFTGESIDVENYMAGVRTGTGLAITALRKTGVELPDTGEILSALDDSVNEMERRPPAA